MTDLLRPLRPARALRMTAWAVALLVTHSVALAQNRAATVRNGDYIAAVVNQELVTAGEVERRVERAQAD